MPGRRVRVSARASQRGPSGPAPAATSRAPGRARRRRRVRVPSSDPSACGQLLDVVDPRADPEARPHGSVAGAAGARAQVPHQRVRAERARPHRDRVLLGQPACDLPRLEARRVERRQRDARRHRPPATAPAGAGPARSRGARAAASRASAPRARARTSRRRPAHRRRRRARSRRRRSACLPRSARARRTRRRARPGRRRPRRRRAAAARPSRCARPRAIEDADAERRVELVAREREVVDPERFHVDRHMRRELGSVDADLGAVVVRELGQLAHGHDLARHVGGARDREEVVVAARQRDGAAREQLVGRVREGQQVDLAPAPGQHVGVVLARGREHARARAAGSAPAR